MKRVYHKYTEWEDFQNGMYEIPSAKDVEAQVLNSMELLKNPVQFLNVCAKVLDQWSVSSEENLTNISCNRQAWLGQSACCFNHGSTEISTRIAWSRLTQVERNIANEVADKVIRSYEAKSKQVYQRLGEPMLYGRNTGRSAKQIRRFK